MITKWPLICIVLVLSSCTSYQYSNKTSNETVTMTSIDYDDPLTLKSIVSINNPQQALL
jgi:hypothetical protein